jgi:two-component system NtrC family sensor kinase
MGHIWETTGPGAVLAAMDHIYAFDARYRVAWVGVTTSLLPVAERAALARGEEVLWRDERNGAPGWLHAIAPVRARGAVVGAIDVSESPPDLRAHVRRTIRATVATTLALSATMMLMTLLVGFWVAGRPISALISEVRRVAAGDLRARALPPHRDELGQLTREFNRMLDRLQAASEEVRTSTDARFVALEQLRHAQRLTTVGRLASGLAHEMGTPLNVISGRARLILEDEREARTHASIIFDQADRMTKIIRQLLDYARRRPPQKEPHNLTAVAREVLPLLGTVASNKRLDLRFRAEVEAAPVTADRAQVQQALTNLIVNAIQASGEGATVEVIVRAARRARRPARLPDQPNVETEVFELAVRDQGPGMAPEILSRVFEPFFTTKPVGEATGLGLSVANEIVEDHGGWIEAESEPGRGSRFALFLPVRAS